MGAMTVALWIARVLAAVGFLDAVWLTASHFAGGSLACGPTGGCDIVTTSRFATVGSVPIAAIGLGYYALVSMLAWTPSDAIGPGVARALAGITGVAFGVSAFLVYLQAAVLDAWCRYCLLSASVTTLLFATAIVIWRRTPDRGATPS